MGAHRSRKLTVYTEDLGSHFLLFLGDTKQPTTDLSPKIPSCLSLCGIKKTKIKGTKTKFLEKFGKIPIEDNPKKQKIKKNKI